MEKEYPMDRLICGDVGFGKTEVAIRAAFKAVTDGKQVAILVPTTILALQHWKTFGERLADFPVTVDYVNRFRAAKRKNRNFQKTQNRPNRYHHRHPRAAQQGNQIQRPGLAGGG
jgi:transcription-repair coupling factor (superfamily II helicase)